MQGVSRVSQQAQFSRASVQPPRLFSASFGGLFLLYLGLCIYLFRDVQINGDGAAYSLQALHGGPWERSVHVGALAPLWLGVRGAGVPPGVVSALWTGLALVASFGIGRSLLRSDPSDPRLPPPSAAVWSVGPLLGPLVMMGAALTWESALFVEIYATTGALLLLTLWGAMAGRLWVTSLTLAWAVTAHPGAWALVPGLLLLAPKRSFRAWAGPLTLAAILQGAVLFLLYPDWWTGGRGLANLPPSDMSLWPALQSLWRILSDDLSLSSLPLLVALPLLDRRRTLGLTLIVLASAGVLCRYSDNPGGLPALWIFAAFSPLAVRSLEAVDVGRIRRGLGALGVLVLLFGIGNATSEHDATSRRALSAHEVRVKTGCPGPSGLPWSQAQLWKLSCGAEDKTRGLQALP